MARRLTPRPTPALTVSLTVAAVLTLATVGTLDLVEVAPAAPDRAVVVPAVRDEADAEAHGRGIGTGDAAPVVTTPAPVALHVPALGVGAPLVPVGVLEGGVMEIPDDVLTVGWYATRARRISPGDPGTAVLAGHRDSRTQGAGALHDLGALEAGDTVDVVHLDGTVSTWKVDEVLLTPRDALPTGPLYATDGPPRLAIVSCGGTFDRTSGHYTDNLIVFASPAGDAPVSGR